MKNPKENKKKQFSKSIVFSLVFLVLGFIVAYSYSLSNTEENNGDAESGALFEQEERFREQLIQQQERNKALREELREKQAAVQEFEKDFSGGEERYTEYTEEAESLRRSLGLLAVKGNGLKVTLEDGEYSRNATNPNNYIVHESHIFQVINELYIAGAQAISINGQRIHSNSTVVCTGPVIEVDGVQYPAPFTVEAIGKPDVLEASMEMDGGVLDQLVNDNIIVTMDSGQMIKMPALLTES